MSAKFPNGWSKTTRDLIAENRFISAEEMSWAREYEKSQLRLWVKFPVNGEIYEAICDVEVRYVTHWSAPYTGGDKCILVKGTKVRVILNKGENEPLVVSADPLEYEKIEQETVPEAERKAFKYKGFNLSIKTAELNRSFKLVTT